MKELKLSTFERIKLWDMMSSRTGTPADLTRNMKIIEKLDLSEKERKQIGYQEDPRTGRLTWQENGEEWAIELEDHLFARLKNYAKTYNQWPTDIRIITLLDKKLGINLDEED